MYRKVWRDEILSFLLLTSIPSHQNKAVGIRLCGLLKGQLKLEWGECEKGQECTLLLSNLVAKGQGWKKNFSYWS